MRSKESLTCLAILFLIALNITGSSMVSAQTRRGAPRVTIPNEIPTSTPRPEKPGKNSKNKVIEMGPEITIDLVGLKIRDVPYVIQGETRLVPVVVAVQENGTAFLAGISPGDVIGWAEYKDWPGSYELARFVFDDHRNDKYRSLTLRVYFPVDGSLRLGQETYNLDYISSDKAIWINTVPKHTSAARAALPELVEARLTLKSDFDNLHNDTMRALESSPCSMVGPTISSRVTRLVTLARLLKQNYSYLEKLTELSETACTNSREGEISNNELIVRLFTGNRRLDPCSYDATKNYRETINDLSYSAKINLLSKKEYDEALGRRVALVYYLRDEEPKKRECMLDLLKSLIHPGKSGRQ